MSQSLVGKLAFSFVCVPAALIIFGNGVANAGQTVNEAGTLVCVNDKWDEKELEKGHKLVDYAGRCVDIPDDPAAEKYTEDCVGKYEYMADQSWKGSGSCTLNFKDKSDHLTSTWEEGSHLKEYPYKYSDGTGKYKGAKGAGAYTYDQLTDTLSGGKYKGKLELP
jgi:hypothetical protein